MRGEFTEQVFPDAAPRPAHEAVIDRRWRTIGFRAIAPAAAALEHMYDATDDAPVIRSLDAAYIGRQLRLDPRPLFVAQPEQIPAHHSSPNTNHYRIVGTKRLMSSDPSITVVIFSWHICLISESMGHHDSEIMDDRGID
jgi:hypothetical protein